MSFLQSALLNGEGFQWLSFFLIVSLKGTVVLVTALLLSRLLRRAPASVRHVVWCTALCSLLVLPLLANGFQQLRVPILPSSLFPAEVGSSEVRPSAAAALSSVNLGATPSEATGMTPSAREESPINGQATLPSTTSDRGRERTGWISLSKIVILAWLAGVLLVLLRLLIGVISLRRIVSDAKELSSAPWSTLSHDLSKQLNLRRAPRLMQSEQAVMPMTVRGLLPIVLLPNEAEHWSNERRSIVVLHELVHIKRRDVLTSMLAQITCALHWFNPFAWYALFQLRKEQERACDEQVLSTGVNATEYADHLFEIARSFRSAGWPAVTATGIASRSQLEDRLTAILRPHTARYRTATAMCLSIAIMAAVLMPLFASRLVRAEAESEIAVRANLAREQDPGNQEAESVTRVATGISQAKASPGNAPQSSSTASPTPEPNSQEPKNEMIDPGSAGFSVEDQNRLTNNGIGPAYILELKDAGYPNLTAAQLIALRSNGVRAEYIGSLKSVGYGGLPANDLIGLKTNGITRDVIKSFQSVKYADFRATNYIAFKSNGVTPAYLTSMRAAGYDRLTPKQIVDMWVAGVTANFIKSARSRGHSNLSPEQLIELKRHGSP